VERESEALVALIFCRNEIKLTHILTPGQIYVGGNGGASPRHAQLFATDVPPNQVVRILDRYLMFYIKTADKLMRTARWMESFDGGIDKLKKIILEDELGICDELDKAMDALVGVSRTASA
jgi:nitrite reductase (NAD(P)H)